MKIFITAGGTGGHIFPGIALFDAFLAAGDDVFFLGGERDLRFEAVRRLGQRFLVLPGGPLYRTKILRNFRTIRLFFKALVRARALLKNLQPDVCVGMGGYITGPLLLACRMRGIPYVLCEQNAYPGFANRRFAGKAERILLTFPEAAARFSKRAARRAVLTGNPVRPGFVKADRNEARRFFGIPAGRRVLAVTGGSQGAAGINQALLSLQKELKGTIVLWSCGEKHFSALKEEVTSGDYRLFPFVERMDLFLAAADLVVSRAGATSLAEIAVSGKPSLLVPYPFATADHQTANAAGFAAAGAAVVVPEGENFRDRLAVELAGLLADKKRLAVMGKAAAACYRQDTVERIIACIREAGSRGRK